MNTLTYCYPLENILYSTVTNHHVYVRATRIGNGDGADFGGGYFYNPSDESAWANFALPPPIDEYVISGYRDGGALDISGYCSVGWGGGVAPPPGTQIFTLELSIAAFLPELDPEGYAFPAGLAVFVVLTGESVGLTYESPDAIAMAIDTGQEMYGYPLRPSFSCHVTPPTNLSVLVAVGTMPSSRTPVETSGFWTQLIGCDQI